jgi:hypothetical protein
MATPIVMLTVTTTITAVNIPMKQSISMIIPTNTLTPTPINMNIPMVMKNWNIPTAMSILIPTNTATDIAGIMVKMVPAVVTAAMSKIKILKS